MTTPLRFGIDSWCCQPWGDHEADDDGRLAWHLVLGGVRRIEPVPTKGSLSLPWFAPPEVADLVWGQLPDLAAR